MAKLTGPLLSFGAQGQVGKTLVTASWKGVKYARQYVVPANPQTSEQSATRDVFTMLNGLWLISPTLFRAPWTANALGQKYTDRNKLLAENVGRLRSQLDMDNFIGSPGALGGPPLDAVGTGAGVNPGEIAVTATAPAIPTDWTLASVTWVAFPDQDPALPFGGPFASLSDASSPYSGTLTGLTPGASCQVLAWPVWTRPDARTAYGPSLITQATAHA